MTRNFFFFHSIHQRSLLLENDHCNAYHHIYCLYAYICVITFTFVENQKKKKREKIKQNKIETRKREENKIIRRWGSKNSIAVITHEGLS